MNIEFPNDADGDSLRRIANSGSDMSKPMVIDFQIAVPSEVAAKAVAEVAYDLGYRVSIYDSSECNLPWTCECSTRMLPTYEGVLAIQNELGAISSRFSGQSDGWGTFGNGREDQAVEDKEAGASEL